MPDSAPATPLVALSVVELINAAEGVRRAQGPAAAVALYQAWIAANGDNPLLYAVLFNFAVVLTDSGDLAGARSQLERAVVVNPDFIPTYINLGRVYERMGAANLAVLQWTAATDRLAAVTGASIAHKTTALNQTARVLEGANQDQPAQAMLRQSLELDPRQREAVQHLLALRQRQCEWPIIDPWERMDAETLMTGMSPLSLAAYADDPMLQLAAAWNYNRLDVGAPPELMDLSVALARGDDQPLRIGYLSSDLRHHAIGHLTAEIYGLHDRSKVEVFAYYCGPELTDPLQKRIMGDVDHWVAINRMDDATAARRIAQDGVQILVDVNGYTRDGRTRLLAMRPAPVIVNWLGFPGTTGSPYHHYIVADDFIIPPGDEAFYSEQVLRLPCYQPNDRKRRVSPFPPTRREAGLPDDAVVYCSFNGTQKITPFTLDRWFQVLERVPNSVLWLLSGSDDSHARLKARASERGLSPERLVFADKMANPEHLARYVLADVFLDALPYGAHTTASDALWMGVPIVTLAGRSFAARVCGSILTAAGLPELVCDSPEAFVDTAVALGLDADRLADLKTRILDLRDDSVLFDTPKLVAALEDLYAGMWRDLREDRLPVPDLSNLDVYLEVGATQTHDAFDMLAVEDHRGWWRERLARRHAHRPIPADKRLWEADR
ncbi:O-linked N-acetylglucosamine transferase, SPINDLY family protein [Caulobacter hibisci]|uniref:Glycosyl transferase n=1 Tax=Caulobacter hibisci TaxID=2035993 RepID=A0ABS0T6W8_9CAUL|nr:glycosyl transferase [Caulobacter hibisci]MBI1686835.1 glycosyl transferase [Caulobacter hibisci]